MIHLRDASISVLGADGPRTILHPTTLSLTERRTAIIGANGSGKSSLARLINGLIEPTLGTVDVDGLDPQKHGSAVRRRVGFVFTNPAAQLIMPTVIEDVMLSLRNTIKSRVDRTTAAQETLSRFGLADLADRSVHSLSGGQQQLLAIASVLATHPQILVADEPTTLLDLRNSRLIAELLLGLEQQLVLVTHDLEFAARCERVIVVDSGRVVRDSADAQETVHATIDWYRSNA